jgi:hypothetical protein
MFAKRYTPRYPRSSLALVGLAAVVLGCSGASISIKNLLEDPSRYDGKTVRISGEVTESIGVLGYGAYGIDDGTGTMTVVAKGGGAPRKGSKVTVRGPFHSGFTFGATSLAVIEEKDRETDD